MSRVERGWLIPEGVTVTPAAPIPEQYAVDMAFCDAVHPDDGAIDCYREPGHEPPHGAMTDEGMVTW